MPLVNNKWPMVTHSVLPVLTHFTEPVCAQISVQDFPAARTSDLNQCRITQAPVAVPEACAWAVAQNEYCM